VVIWDDLLYGLKLLLNLLILFLEPYPKTLELNTVLESLIQLCLMPMSIELLIQMKSNQFWDEKNLEGLLIPWREILSRILEP